MTLATPGLYQLAGRSHSHERMQGEMEGICLRDAGPRGEGTL
jgi:hypothetical protein